MKVLVSPSGFKESLEPAVAAECIEAGIKRVDPNAEVKKTPLVDGGEGFCRALVEATSGQLHEITVTGPVGLPVESHFGFLGGQTLRTAVVEMAASSGLRHVPKDQRNPCVTTTYGVGETIAAALNLGAERILVGCGDSGTSDGGAGMIQALGGRLVGKTDLPIAGGGGDLIDLTSIDLSRLHPGLATCQVDVACNWHNVLCGEEGVARVFGPQKGATPEQVEQLAAALDNFAAIVSKQIGKDIALAPGSGASGGLGAGLMLIGATLHPRYDIIMQYFDFDALLSDCQLVFTAEGAVDYQTPRGKVPAEVGMRAKAHGLPVIALAGTVGERAEDNYASGIDAYVSMLQKPTSLEEAIQDAERLLTDSAETAMRMVMIGSSIERSRSATPEPQEVVLPSML